MSKISWIQLSDLHFGHNSPFCKKSQEALQSFVLEHCKGIDYIFITGDIIYAADAKDSKRRKQAYQKAEHYLKDICGSLWGSDELDHKITERVFIVPGNHMEPFCTFYKKFASKANWAKMQNKMHFVIETDHINILHGVAHYNAEQICWNEFNNELQEHKMDVFTPCTNQKALYIKGYCPVCFSLKPYQDEVVWNRSKMERLNGEGSGC